MEGLTEREESNMKAESATVSRTQNSKAGSSALKRTTKKTDLKAKPSVRTKRESREEQVERVLTDINDLLDEHEAELKEVKDRVQFAITRTTSLRRVIKAAAKELSQHPELEAELADYRKKFHSLRNLVV